MPDGLHKRTRKQGGKKSKKKVISRSAQISALSRDAINVTPAHSIDLGNYLILQRKVGNKAVQEAVGNQSIIQRRLPSVKMPAAPAASKYPAGLMRAAQDYLKNKLDSYKAEVLTDAVAKHLEGQGTVKFKGQPDVVPGSPEFKKGASSEAKRVASTRKGMDLSVAAGFTYEYDRKGGKPRYKVEIYYPNAFTGLSANEVIGFLAGVITHEYIHLLQYRGGGAHTDAQMEFQAYLWQAENAIKMGIKPRGDAANEIMAQLKAYYKKLSAKDRRRYRSRYRVAFKALRTRKRSP